jgi:hypothetical protein
MLEDPEVKEEKRTIRNSHSNLEIIFGNVFYNTQFQKVNVLSILKDISMNIVKL